MMAFDKGAPCASVIQREVGFRVYEVHAALLPLLLRRCNSLCLHVSNNAYWGAVIFQLIGSHFNEILKLNAKTFYKFFLSLLLEQLHPDWASKFQKLLKGSQKM